MENDALLIKNLVLQNPDKSYDKIFKNSLKRFTIISKNGQVIFDSFSNSIENHSSRPEFIKALKNSQGSSVRKSNTTGHEMIYFALKLDNNDVIRVSVDSNNATRNILFNMLIHIILFILLNLFAVFSYRSYLRRNLFDKINKIKEMLEDGNKVTEVEMENNLWLSKFWLIIKEWQDTNLKNIDRLKLEKIKLNNIITSVDMGILLINENKYITLKNNSINYIYTKQNSEKYAKDIKYPEIIKFIDNILYNENEETKEIFLEDIKKYILVHGKYMKSRKEYLFTLKDITRDRETLDIQKKFITNVGHELKTPLTSISGYLIALKEEDEPLKRKRFLNIIERNAKKIDLILMDFLDLSKIENSKIINLAPIETKTLVIEINSSLENLIESKNANLIFKFNLKNQILKIDFEKTVLILKNLIENAIIYNKKSPKIVILIEESFDRYLISVEDNGIGIPAIDSFRVFDKFYRVDKARTSNISGSGLGLSIVAELVHLCGGEIKVNSEKGKTIFSFSLIK